MAVNMTKEEFDAAVEAMRIWFHDRAETQVELTVPKAIEYGSIDTVNIGKSLISIFGGVPESQIDERTAFEAGVFFFVKGKMARWEAALRRGEQVSDDTLFDISIYVAMVERVRSVGGWPFEDSFTKVSKIEGFALAPTPPGGGRVATFGEQNTKVTRG